MWPRPTAGPRAPGRGSGAIRLCAVPMEGEPSGPHSHFDLRGCPSVSCSVGVRVRRGLGSMSVAEG